MKKQFEIGSNDVVVVTGAAGGLGGAFVKALKNKGAKVVSTDIKKGDGVDDVLDVTNYEQCLKIAEKYEPNIWINNAGLLGPGLIENIDIKIVEAVVNVNILGVIYGTKAAVEVMKNGSKGGSILNIGSLASYSPTYGIGIYSTSKFGVRGFTHTAAQELRRHNIYLSLLCPDGIWTPMLKSEVDNEDAAMPFSSGKLLEPEQVAGLGIKLIEARAMTGSIPLYRAILARFAGEAPKLVSNLGKFTADMGSKTQQKYKKMLS